MLTNPPFSPVNSHFWDTSNPARMLKAGDVPASPGDVLTKWISNDGTKTAVAVGTPILVRRPYSQHPVILFDGSSGFYYDDPTYQMDNQATGSFFCGFRNLTTTSAALPRILGAICNTTTTTRQSAFGYYYTSAPQGQSMMVHGGAIGAYANLGQATQYGAFARVVMSSSGGGAYKFGGSVGPDYAIAGAANNGNWIPSDASFRKTRTSIGYEAISTPRGYVTGEIAYLGWFSQTSQTDLDAINDWLEAEYNTTGILLLGDSRFNTPAFQLAIAELSMSPAVEGATGGHTISQVETASASWLNGSYDPRFVVLLAGVNDSIGTTALSTMQADYISLVEAVRGAFTGTVVVCNETPCKGNVSATDAEAATHRQFSQWIDEYDFGPRVRKVDTFSVLQSPTDELAMNGDYTSDLLHPNTAGYRLLAAAIARELYDGYETGVEHATGIPREKWGGISGMESRTAIPGRKWRGAIVDA